AGRGLAAAHDAGLIHRDFKPENVMIGDDGRVRVMDFGLARSAADVDAHATAGDHALASAGPLENLTRTGTLLGTPAYMSPEQFTGGPVDARSDLFAFCVALYQGLHHQRPFAGESLAELADSVRTGDVRAPPPESAAPRWLHAHLVRGLAPDPDARWPSMSALLEALADDPAARRRRRASGTLAVALVVGGVAGVAMTRAGAEVPCQGMERHLDGAWDGERRVAVQAAILGSGLGFAPGTWERLERRLDDYADAWVSARVDACEAGRRHEHSPALLDLRVACLDRHLGALRANVDELTRGDAELVRRALGVAFALPDVDRCADLEALRAAVPPPADPEVARAVKIIDGRLLEVEAKDRAGRYDEARPLADAALADARSLDYAPLVARAELRLGYVIEAMGERDAAYETLAQTYHDALSLRMMDEASEAAAELVGLYAENGALEDAGTWAAHMRSVARASGTARAEDDALHSLGLLRQKEGDFAAARDLQLDTVRRREAEEGPKSPRLAAALNNLGVTEAMMGDFRASREHHERSAAIYVEVFGPDHPHTAILYISLSNHARREGRLAAARDYLQRAVAIYEDAYAPEHPMVASNLANLAAIETDDGNLEEARRLYERSLALRERLLPPDHRDVAKVLLSLAIVAEKQGRLADARALHERALGILERNAGVDTLIAHNLHGLALIAAHEGKRDEVVDLERRAIAIDEAAVGAEHPLLVEPLGALGEALVARSEAAEGLALLERALSIAIASEVRPADLADARFRLARGLWAAPEGAGGDRRRARELAALARAGRAEAELPIPQDLEAWLIEHSEAAQPRP
ncbi:MAG: serine/threonine protein kinase, partial [Myxococcales bacterium]|nr:serine/threonine protein kinase [Myxococcales bacterium]